MSAHQKKLRCAVYTRKSTEEGLDQEFNSLDAQREACTAFIASQVGLGWRLVADHYDDGGISGGTMERPALQRLLQDIRDRKVDVVVVYKIDRLTRSLMDFSKIVEVFDANDVSFVSVTQQFNTTTSMGRLTLNVLLSFAQFEREVTAERIRDKIAASRKKGMWMGGTVPFGYRAVDKKLVVDEAAAEKVRAIFNRYLELGSVFALADELNAELSIEQALPTTSEKSRTAYSRGKLYHMLANHVYIGKARHRDRIYDGEHEGIVDEKTFAAVQSLLKAQAPNRQAASGAESLHLLTGILFDETGDRLSPVFTVKGGKRYRYYISNRLETARRKDASGWRLPAAELEQTVIHQFCLLFRDEVRLAEWTRTFRSNASIEITLAKAATLRETALQTLSIRERANLLKHIPDQLGDAVRTITIASDKLLADRQSGYKLIGERVADAVRLLQKMATTPNSFGLAQLAANSATPKIDVTRSTNEAFKGRYLLGALRLFGRLQDAGEYLLHSYWKLAFDELGGATATDRHEIIKRTLKKRLRSGQVDSEDAWDRLASLVAREAHQVRMPLQVMSFADLRGRHRPYIENERQILVQRQTKDSDAWIERARNSLRRSVQWLCSRSILYRGYEWRCGTCYHSNWNQIGALKQLATCEVCGTGQDAPVDKSWDFRLNAFLREALKEHGVLALVWCLIMLERRARDTFFFLGPHDLFTNYPEVRGVPGDNEVDLICVVDRKVYLCEVKSSARDIQIKSWSRLPSASGLMSWF